MSKVTVHVGLDYHQDSIQVCIMDHAGKILANRAEAVVATVAARGQDVHAAVEACSGSADLADELANRHGWVINLAHPGYVARMKQAPDKTDWADARVIADLVRVGYLPEVWLAPEDVRQLRTLTRYRQQLVKDRTAAKLRVTALLREHRVVEPGAKRWTKAWMTWLATADGPGSEGRWVADRLFGEIRDLDGSIAEVEGRLAQGAAGDAVVARLLELPGVGRVTAWVLRAVRSVRHRQADGEVLRALAAQRLQRPAAGRRRPDQGGQRGVACDDLRGGPSVDSIRPSMEGVGRDDEEGRQAGLRDRRGDRQPLDSLVVPPGRGRSDRVEEGGVNAEGQRQIRLEGQESPSRPGLEGRLDPPLGSMLARRWGRPLQPSRSTHWGQALRPRPG